MHIRLPRLGMWATTSTFFILSCSACSRPLTRPTAANVSIAIETPQGSDVPLARLNPRAFDLSPWHFSTPGGRYTARLSVANNTLTLHKSGRASKEISLEDIHPQGKMLVTSLCMGPDAELGFWGVVDGTEQSALIQTRIDWSDPDLPLQSSKLIFQGPGFGDVTAISYLTPGADQYLIWDYTQATLSALDPSGGISFLTSSQSYPQLAGKKGMSATPSLSEQTQGAPVSYYYQFVTYWASCGRYASGESMYLMDTDLDLVPDFPH
jgi:hypothetical protein